MECQEDHIKHRQDLFCVTVKSCFFSKITKYKNLLRKHVHLDDDLELATHPSEDEIELVLGLRNTSLKSGFSATKLACQLSSAGLFRWILMLIQKVKARQILAHLKDVPDSEIKTTILEVAGEVAVAYEYQLMVLYGNEEVVKLAQHVVACFITYLNQQEARFTPVNLLQALLEIKLKSSNNKEVIRTKPMLWNNQPVCLKWKIGHILKQPGIRISCFKDTKRESSAICTSQKENKMATREKSSLENVLTEYTTNKEQGLDDVDGSVIEQSYDLQSCDEKHPNMNLTKPIPVNLQNVSAVILGQYTLNVDNVHDKDSSNSGSVTERRISTLDMDFDLGVLNINKYTVQVNDDFSPISHKNATDSDDCEALDLIPAEIQDFEGYSEEQSESTSRFKTGPIKTLNSQSEYNNENEEANISTKVIPQSSGISTKDSYDRGEGAMDNSFDIINNHSSKHYLQDEIVDSETKEYTKQTKGSPKTDLKSRKSITNNVSNGDEPQPEMKSGAEKIYKFYGCFTPYGAKCQPSIYGFRGPLHIWNDNEKKYTLIYNDQVTVNVTHCKEINNENCVHQLYRPKTFCHH